MDSRINIISGIIALTIICSSTNAKACMGAELHSQILFDEKPEVSLPHIAAADFHLTNQRAEFAEWTRPQNFELDDNSVEMRPFSLIGMATQIDPWTYWLTRILPTWLIGEPSYIPVFAPVSSCTRRFSYDTPLDIETVLVGKRLKLKDGRTILAASSLRSSDQRWQTHLQ